MLARAKYSNNAETSDELSFRQGEVLNVLQKDFEGLEGWWLCSLRGKTGLAPGNRLEAVKGITTRSHIIFLTIKVLQVHVDGTFCIAV